MPRPQRLKNNARPEPSLQFLNGGFGIRIDQRSCTLALRVCCAAGKALHLSNRHPAARHAPCGFQAHLRIRNSKQCAAMAGRYSPFLDQVPNLRFEFEQAHCVGDRGAVFPGTLGDLLLRQRELLN
jgi:hypothetical protein